MNTRLAQVLTAIDLANKADPTLEDNQPAALLYGQRMSAELARLCPQASEPLQIAARGQHIERWKLRRDGYPQGRAGYLTWRKDQARHHADLVIKLMQAANFDDAACDAAGHMLRKEGLKRDADVQMLEDVICLVFLKWYFADFATKHTAQKLQRIVEKTARKMSAEGRARVLQEFDLPSDLAGAFAS
jgi:Domain of unknown function (DUF4202)